MAENYPTDDQLQKAIEQGKDLTKPVVDFDVCPHCRSWMLVKLPADWQAQVEAGARIPIIACGNPWHYAGMERPDGR